MLRLIDHIVRISARRDRTEINSAMVDALRDLFTPRRLTLYRCYAGSKRTVLFACAGYGETGQYLRNAYLPDHHHCEQLEHDPLHLRCWQEMSPIMEIQADGTH